MTRIDAMDLAQRKANDWNAEYRVLRSLGRGNEQSYNVEKGGSCDSPKGFHLVEVFGPSRKSASA